MDKLVQHIKMEINSGIYSGKIGGQIMEYSKFVLFFREYNGVGDSMDIDSWDDKSKEFDTEDELREYISNQPSYLFRPKAVYRLDNTILELE